MNQKNFLLVAGLIFLLVALVHILRLIFQWEAAVAGIQVPMWISFVGTAVFGYLAYEGLKLGREKK